MSYVCGLPTVVPQSHTCGFCAQWEMYTCFGHYSEVAEGAVLFIHKSTLAWCKFRLRKTLSIVILLLGNSLLHMYNGLVNSIEHACVLITLIPTDYTCITHLQTELLLCASPVSTKNQDL